MVHDIKEFIENEHLLQPHDKVLVAVSGGVDSVVLAHVLNELGYQIGMAHANFRLRGADSEADENFTRGIAQNLNVPVYTKKFNTATHAKNAGISTQMAARELRYPWFEELRKQHGFHAIATAHHADDVVETILLNLTRGTGISGLRGILSKQNHLIRPLLSVDKQRIKQFAESQGLKWREDLSNQNDYYQRNLIRNQVIPLLKQINPKLVKTTTNTTEILKSVEHLYHESIAQLRKRLLIPSQQHVEISKLKVRQMPAPLLADLLMDYGFNLEQCRSVLLALDQSGKVFYSDNHTLNVDRDQIIISPQAAAQAETAIESLAGESKQIGSQTWNFSLHAADSYTIKSDYWVAALDYDKVTFPLKIRKWSRGDKFCPLGMSRHKKISDFLVDNKVPVNYKDAVQVLLSKGRIVWVVGHRIDNRFKVTRTTKNVLQIIVETPNDKHQTKI